MSELKCFISYSWDSDEHKSWVRDLATNLESSGIRTFLDQWDVRPGMDLLQYMNKSVRDSDFVILVCTPKYCDKVNNGIGGAGWESNLITGELFHQVCQETKFIPIIRDGDHNSSLPTFLRSRVYIDFRRDSDFDLNIERLLRHIYDEPEYRRPKRGTRPAFFSPGAQIIPMPLKDFSKLAFEWKAQGSPEFLIEGLSETRKAFVRQPPPDTKIDDVDTALFFVRCGLHYGGNWPFWLSICPGSQELTLLILKAANSVYDRVKLRALYAMQFTDYEAVEKAIIDSALAIPEHLKDTIKKHVFAKSVLQYLDDLSATKDNLASKAKAVAREVRQFGHKLEKNV